MPWLKKNVFIIDGRHISENHCVVPPALQSRGKDRNAYRTTGEEPVPSQDRYIQETTTFATRPFVGVLEPPARRTIMRGAATTIKEPPLSALTSCLLITLHNLFPQPSPGFWPFTSGRKEGAILIDYFR